MRTTIYQKFIPRYGEMVTLVSIDYDDAEVMEIVPHALVAKMNQEEHFELLNELISWENEKADWTDEEDTFDEQDVRDGAHMKWDEINSCLDKMGI